MFINIIVRFVANNTVSCINSKTLLKIDNFVISKSKEDFLSVKYFLYFFLFFPKFRTFQVLSWYTIIFFAEFTFTGNRIGVTSGQLLPDVWRHCRGTVFPKRSRFFLIAWNLIENLCLFITMIEFLNRLAVMFDLLKDGRKQEN